MTAGPPRPRAAPGAQGDRTCVPAAARRKPGPGAAGHRSEERQHRGSLVASVECESFVRGLPQPRENDAECASFVRGLPQPRENDAPCCMVVGQRSGGPLAPEAGAAAPVGPRGRAEGRTWSQTCSWPECRPREEGRSGGGRPNTDRVIAEPATRPRAAPGAQGDRTYVPAAAGREPDPGAAGHRSEERHYPCHVFRPTPCR